MSGTQTINDFLSASGSIKLTETLRTQAGNRTVRAGTITLKPSSWNVTTVGYPDFIVSVHTSSPTFNVGQQVRMTAIFFDRNEQSRASKFPIQVSQSEIYGVRYRLRDSLSGELLFDFCDGSKMSLDSGGWFTELPTGGMKVGSTYTSEFEVMKNGKMYHVNDRSTRLRAI